MIGIIIILVFAVVGVLSGMTVIVPYSMSKYVVVAILAFIDSLFGGITSNMQRQFKLSVFISGFFGNALIAIFLVYIGEKLDVDIYLAAVIVFSTRLFSNFSIMRRLFIEKTQEKIKAKKEAKKESAEKKI